MKTLPAGPKLLLRTYAIIVGGLILFAAALDFGFSRLQGPVTTPREWVDGTLGLIEAQLRERPAADWPAALGALEEQLGFPVKILPKDHVIQASPASESTQEVFDEAGRSAFFRKSLELDAGIQIGPLPGVSAPESYLLKLVPPLFYLAILALVSLWLWPLIRDVNLLTDAAREFATDYRQAMNTGERATTLKDLANSFDDMAARIRSLIEGQKELASALSHEIRTPLARIKFAMAVINDNPAITRELQSINQDVQEIDRLVGTMLDYARLDHPDTEMNWQLTPVDVWLEDIVSKWRACGRALHVEIDDPERLVRMDPVLMEIALNNLMVNAHRYARKSIAVRFGLDGVRCVLAVEDDGPGIPERDRQAVFKAFTRLDDSRSRETGGYGLGLAIVARVAALHGGSATIEDSSRGGARVVIGWPID